ncbi:hypothetical protein RRF57_009920 [Xylaria bambusicola]|uniref:Uncharacterized protein n=1 Tax=Xylaria bambusicola TaxID=326684 RepID=A0AAN7ZCC5_9PEZI
MEMKEASLQFQPINEGIKLVSPLKEGGSRAFASFIMLEGRNHQRNSTEHHASDLEARHCCSGASIRNEEEYSSAGNTVKDLLSRTFAINIAMYPAPGTWIALIVLGE